MNGTSSQRRSRCDDVIKCQDLAAALPPLRPAFFFCAVVPPWLESPPEPEFFQPRRDDPAELATRAARPLDIPLSLRASYCFSFFMFARLAIVLSPRMDVLSNSSPLTLDSTQAVVCRSSGPINRHRDHLWVVVFDDAPGWSLSRAGLRGETLILPIGRRIGA